jgi:hypothetical protein
MHFLSFKFVILLNNLLELRRKKIEWVTLVHNLRVGKKSKDKRWTFSFCINWVNQSNFYLNTKSIKPKRFIFVEMFRFVKIPLKLRENFEKGSFFSLFYCDKKVTSNSFQKLSYESKTNEISERWSKGNFLIILTQWVWNIIDQYERRIFLVHFLFKNIRVQKLSLEKKYLRCFFLDCLKVWITVVSTKTLQIKQILTNQKTHIYLF